MIDSQIVPLVAVINKIGNAELKKQAAAFEVVIRDHREFLNIAATHSKPDDASFAKLFAPTAKGIADVVKIRDDARGNALWNHLSALSEAVPALNWVSVKPTPGPFVNEFKGNSEFYTNKLLREFKGKDEDQVAFCNHLKEFFVGLIALIKNYHTTELKWNAQGSAAPASAPAPAAGGPPPPPAGGPPPPPPADSTPHKGPDVGALFASINQGVGVSSGLKKVTSDMKTKNRKPEERSAVVPAAATAKKAPVRAAAVKKGTPKFALVGAKWVVEFQDDNKELIIKDTEPKQTVYIYKCDNSVVQILGQKVNSICVDSCNKLGLVFNSAIAVVELVNSNNVEVQCTGAVPAYAIDKCSGVQLYIAKSGVHAEIVSSKSDQMNVLLTDEHGEVTEIAIPEQFKTVISGNKLVTSNVEHV